MPIWEFPSVVSKDTLELRQKVRDYVNKELDSRYKKYKQLRDLTGISIAADPFEEMTFAIRYAAEKLRERVKNDQQT